MQLLDFLRKVLPSSGWYFVSRRPRQFWENEPYDDIETVAARIEQIGHTENVWFAVNSFRQREYLEDGKDKTTGAPIKVRRTRTQDNTLFCRSFYMDIDVDPDNEKKYPSYDIAIKDLAEFLKQTGLPFPMVVSSGHGLHLYWPMTEDILVTNWKAVSDLLATLARSLGLRADTGCTIDSARVLRPISTLNFKAEPVPVSLVRDCEPVDYEQFRKLVENAAKEFKVTRDKGSKTRKLTSEITANDHQLNSHPSYAERIAHRCQQIGTVKDLKGKVEEPVWYSAIQLLHFTHEGDQIVHEWSKGDERYSEEETNRKIDQIVKAEVGPTTCARFEIVNSKGCRDCPYRGKIHSPISLGRKFEEAEVPLVENIFTGEQEQLLPPPQPFRRIQNETLGYTQLVADIDGVDEIIYPYDLYPVGRLIDDGNGEHSFILKHWSPKEEWQEFVVPQQLFARPTDFHSTMLANGVNPPGGYEQWILRMLKQWVADLQEKKLARRLSVKMGWTSNPEGFQVGERLYTKNGVYPAGVSKNFKELAKDMVITGDLAEWRKLTEFFSEPGMEPYLFMFGTAFGAPLIKLSGYNGAFVNLYSAETGCGKSLTGFMMASVWGKQTAREKDTNNFYEAAIAFYSNLPYYIDELTEISPEKCNDLVMSVTQGRGKGRMRSDTSIRETGEWQTIVCGSANESLRQKISVVRQSSAAAQMRILEFRVDKHSCIQQFGDIAHEILPTNYGVAGHVYADWLSKQDSAELRKLFKTLEIHLRKELGSSVAERYWLGAITCVIFGLTVAKSLGIVLCDPKGLIPWLKQQLGAVREQVAESAVGIANAFGQFMADNIDSRLTIQKLGLGDEKPEPESPTQRTNRVENMIVERPRERAAIQHDLTSGEISVNVQHFRVWCAKNRYNMQEVLSYLQEKGCLIERERRVTIGGGTVYTLSSRCVCFVVDSRKLEQILA